MMDREEVEGYADERTFNYLARQVAKSHLECLTKLEQAHPGPSATSLSEVGQVELMNLVDDIRLQCQHVLTQTPILEVRALANLITQIIDDWLKPPIKTWTFFGHWADDSTSLILDHVVEGEHQDLRVDSGQHECGLFAASAEGTSIEEAEAAVREEYETEDGDG